LLLLLLGFIIPTFHQDSAAANQTDRQTDGTTDLTSGIETYWVSVGW